MRKASRAHHSPTGRVCSTGFRTFGETWSCIRTGSWESVQTMSGRAIPLSIPHMASDVVSRLERVLAENWIANMGPSVDAFERELAERVGAAACLATHSATAALHL